MKIAVTGATGLQIGAVAQLLTERGHDVRRVTRNPKRPNEVAQGKAAIDAAQHVQHVVFTSATNADRGTGIPHFDTKAEIERHLAAHHPHWTVLGPAAFMGREGPVFLPIPPDLRLFIVAPEDIAAVVVLAFEQPDRFRNRRIDIASDRLTGPQMAAVRGTEFIQVPLAQAEQYSNDLAAMFRHHTEIGLDLDLAALHAEFPEVGWHSYADWISARRTSSATSGTR